jgi:phosphohistidine phosphatase SixA
MMIQRRTLLLGALAAAALAAAPAQAQDGQALVVFLVRHAEKVDSSRDAALSEAGHARAKALAHVLRDAGIEQVHSTDFARTRDTGGPFAEAAGLPVQIYDPYDLPGFAETLKGQGGRHLVVGHSNTTPQLAELLGGGPTTPINEAGEYDRLYVVTIGADGEEQRLLMRYGAAYEAE